MEIQNGKLIIDLNLPPQTAGGKPRNLMNNSAGLPALSLGTTYTQ